MKTILMLLMLSQGTTGPSISEELKALFDADQKQRDGTIDWSKASPEENQAAIQRDVERAKRVREILATHNVENVNDLIFAGTVLMLKRCSIWRGLKIPRCGLISEMRSPTNSNPAARSAESSTPPRRAASRLT